MNAKFTPDELLELVDVLAGHDRELIREIARAEHREFKHGLQRKEDFLTELQGKLLSKECEFSTEELEALRVMLEHNERMLYGEISRTDHREFKHMLQQRLDRLVGLRQRIAGLRTAA
jgi:predicted house-cleaning noncanonical NTP pyrophosphatase (MazG superfamily)